MKKFNLLIILALFLNVEASAFTECFEKVTKYFVGTGEVDQPIAHLWLNFESGNSGSMGSESAAFESVLSTVLYSLASDKNVVVRSYEDDVSCSGHHSDMVGLWLLD